MQILAKFQNAKDESERSKWDKRMTQTHTEK